jgi:hypothetical protein
VTETSSRDGWLIVFAQRAQVLLEIEAWNNQGERFFGTRIGLAEPCEGGSRLVVAPTGCEPGVRSAVGRARNAEDLARADRAEGLAGGGGLALLSRRCHTVWLVEREHAEDLLALHLAAVMASVLLGPILDPVALELFGVRTARAKLDAASRAAAHVSRS